MSAGQMAENIHRSFRGLPASMDGLSDAQAAPLMEGKQHDEGFLLRAVKSVNGQ
ncbi:hypothetical protein FS842_006536, partial [Serendipita sp. 407]